MSQASLIGAWSTAAAPPTMLTISEWSDARRILPESSGARGGQWHTDAVPYLRGIMDAVHEPGVRLIALMKAAQCGGSEALHNIVGYHVEHDPCPMLFVHPTASVADEWSKERLSDMIRTTPALAAVISDKRKSRGSHEAESTVAMKIFPGGYLATGGANTENTFARRSVRIAIGDDVDRFPAVVGDEGDPADLLANRTTSFYDALVLMVSTPTLKGGRIDTLYRRSDQRRYFVPCQRCGRLDWLTWNHPQHFRVVFEDRDPETARIVCPSSEHGGCGAPHDEPQRRQMIAEGQWQATAVTQERGHIGFHLPAMVSTIGDVTIPRLVEKWLSARARGKESLRVFINTSLAEGWEDRTVKIEPHVFMARREAYGAEGVEVPYSAVCLTAGVDVQDNRFELLVQAWGPAEERWVVDWRRIPGDPKQQDTREALLEALGRRYTHAIGVQVPILATCLDTGYATDEMYNFVLAYQVRRFFATKGFGGRSGEPIVGKPSEKRSGKNPRPIALYPINTDDGKGDILGSLNLNLVSALDGRPSPGATHFPVHLDTVDEEFFAQLCAEHRETKYNKGGVATHAIWVQDREANHALDCAVLCLAAKRLLNPNIRHMAEMLAEAAKQQAIDGARPPDERPRPTKPEPPAPRVGRSSYLQR
jgi:phage terminase large subunit GpA-like protein